GLRGEVDRVGPIGMRLGPGNREAERAGPGVGGAAAAVGGGADVRLAEPVPGVGARLRVPPRDERSPHPDCHDPFDAPPFGERRPARGLPLLRHTIQEITAHALIMGAPAANRLPGAATPTDGSTIGPLLGA